MFDRSMLLEWQERVQQMQDATNQTVDQMRDQVQATTETLKANTEQTLQTVMDGTTQTVNSFWDQTSQIGQMPQAAVNGFQHAIADSIQAWLADHPVVHWLVNHPIWGLILTVTSIFLFWGLLQAVADLTRQFWQMLIRLPLILGQWLSSQVIRLGAVVVKKVRSRLWKQPNFSIRSEPSNAIPSKHIAVNRLLLSSTTQGEDVILNGAKPINSDAVNSETVNLDTINLDTVNSEKLTPLSNSKEIVQLLHRLEKLGQEQNQILRQIAALAERDALVEK